MMQAIPNHSHHQQDAAWIQSRFAVLPDDYHTSIAREYTERFQQAGQHDGEKRRNANLFLLNLAERAQKRVFTLSAAALVRKSERLALLCRRLVREAQEPERAFQAVLAVYQQQGFSVEALQATHEGQGIIARLSDADWWFRKLLRYQDRAQEAFAIQLGEVRRGRGLYLSQAMFKQMQARIQSSIQALANLEAVNESTGETVDMLTVLKSSVANPELRRIELMVRMRGFEEAANQAGHVGMFYTLTCPSKFHRFTTEINRQGQKRLAPNPSYGNYTPREAQNYLTGLWARVRAKLKRDGLIAYGFRIAEPHHDGCPHWHMLLFVQPEQQAQVTAILQDYALREDGTEKGAAAYRFQAVAIDPKKGSATGYIAKYVSKNINGFGVDEDHEGQTNAQDSSQRVRAWASLWGIRQFQQIGGAPVGVWRELRRLDAAPEGLLEQARIAADQADWYSYLQLQGGVLTARNHQPLRIYTVERIDTETGEVLSNRYGELVDKVEGVSLLGAPALKTRVHIWKIQTKDTATKASLPVPESSIRFDFSSSGAAAQPRSTVNNCTQAPNSEVETAENDLEDDQLLARRERAAIILESLASLETLKRPAQVLETQERDFTSTTFTESQTCKSQFIRP
ncbi:MAG: replication endonuclease [Thiolinea sp.]